MKWPALFSGRFTSGKQLPDTMSRKLGGLQPVGTVMEK
jgi:hypothetical protein